jgi:hypothetical protein
MRARAAFIHSLGTTGILVAAALLMLAIVSALVAFRAWPGGTGESVAAVPVTPHGGDRVDLKQVRTAPAPRAAVRRLAAPVRERVAAERPAATGLVKVTVVDTTSTEVVKVPPGVRMTVPPPQTPSTRPPTIPVDTGDRPPPVAGDDPALLPEPALPPGGADAVEDTLAGIVEPLPGDAADAPTVSVAPGNGTIIDVTVGSTRIHVGLD